jgi:GTP-binding protein
MTNPEKIRNIAIIAHIDHGKTTLLDSLLRQSHIFRENQVLGERMMDSFDQERERGITIFAKHTSIPYEGYKINIIDTPGHADFSCEVERILGMVSSVLLLVDAQEGPMPQTRFVLSKALKLGLRPIVVINKIDRPFANPHKVLDETFDLFIELGATDAQLDFAHCYASGLAGFAMRNLEDARDSMKPLYEMIIENVSPPPADLGAPFLLQSSTLFYDDYVGRKACGRVLQGSVKKGDTVVHVGKGGKQQKCIISRVEGHIGLEKIELDEGVAGDIVILSGIPEVTIGDTLSSPDKIEVLPPIQIGEPTVSIDISVNSSPFAGRSGKHVTMNKIKDRLEREKRANISLKINFSTKDQEIITVAGRGELHLGVLVETLRREGYELSISKPRVILKEENGITLEPIERATIEVPEEFSGTIIQELSQRKGELQHLSTSPEGITTLEFLIPTRGLLGYRNDFLTITRGLGILTSIFEMYGPHKGEIQHRYQGALVANAAGRVTAYACFYTQERGTLFVGAGDEVYEGMVVGEHSRENDLVVNVTKEKHMTNVRAAGCDENIILTPPRRFNLEQAICYIHDDELLEVTPDAVRMRKKHLTELARKRAGSGLSSGNS